MKKLPSKTDQLIQKNGTVLIVDDEPYVVEVLSKMLQRLGYETIEANTGKDAIAIYTGENNLVDWVVLDLHLGDMDGTGVYEKLKSINPAFQVLFMTGGNEDHVSGIKPKEGEPFLQKPFSLKSLSSVLGDTSQNPSWR